MFNGKKYGRAGDNTVYDLESQDEVGTWDAEKQIVVFNQREKGLKEKRKQLEKGLKEKENNQKKYLKKKKTIRKST